MADDAATEESPVTFNIKSSNDSKYVLSLPLSVTVLDLKNKLAGSDYADIPPERQRLIYSGRVLKDPDTLASYKIKEGNTVHLVKGAASNQRQNPPNANTTPVNTGTASGSSGVPTNIAAGTGNNPLAGLTGARYAGFAQLPGAGMFGPDGGMGPPPDPEHMISMLENPRFASTMNEALQNPLIVDQMIQGNPLLRNMGPQVREAMNDPNFRRMMTDPAIMRQMSQISRQFGLGGGGLSLGGRAGGDAFPAPGVTDTTPTREGEGTAAAGSDPSPPPNPFGVLGNLAAGGLGGGVAAQNQLATLLQGAFANRNVQPNPPGAQTPQGQDNATTEATPGAADNPFAPSPLNPFAQNILNPLNPQNYNNPLNSRGQNIPNPLNPLAAMFGPEGLLTTQQLAAQQAAQQAAAPPDTRPPEERYEEQLRQLNDMGFYEFERNIEALRRAGGSVQGAVEYLLTH